MQTLPRGTQLEITSVIHNTRGSEWYAVNFGLETRYVYGGDTEPSTWKVESARPIGRADCAL